MDSNGRTTGGHFRTTQIWACRVTALVAVVLTLPGCPSIADPYAPMPMPDYNQFVSDVQPLVGRSCGVAGCHGTRGESLTLYAVDYLRAPQEFSNTPLDEKHLTDAELSWNFDALRARIRGAASAESSELVLKCLDPAAGGIRHGTGVVVFSDRNDPAYKKLVTWVSGGLK